MSKDSVNTKVKKAGLLQSSAVVAVMTMLSRVLGLVRDVVVAVLFGAGAGADAFFVAFKIPNFFRRLFAEGAFAQSFVPVLTEYQQKKAHEQVKDLVNHVAGTLGCVLFITTVIAVVGAPVLAMVFAPGFSSDQAKYALTVDMLRLTFPYLMLISLTAFAGGILNSYGRFAVPAFTPVLLNLSLIGSALLIAPYLDVPVMALAYGVLIAGVVQLLFQLPFLGGLGLFPKPQYRKDHEGVKKIVSLMIPALFGVSVSQINLLLDTVLASFLQTGSVAWLYYSDRLTELPLGVFGIAIATVILPSLSKKHSNDDSGAFSQTLDWAVRMVMLIGVPAMLALIVLAEPLVSTLFFHGALTADDIPMITASLRAYSLGLLAFMLIKVLAPGFFSRQDTKTPVKIAIRAMIANMVLNLLLVWHLDHVGLALATSISSWLNALWLYLALRKDGVFAWQPGFVSYLFKLLVSCGAMLAVLVMLMPGSQIWYDGSVLERVFWLTAMVVSGGLSYFVVLLICGFRPRHFKGMA
ncbi:murein biosynthesis integral membrane protein MurJ [Litoribacillus peritrichatus]|uniref:murein biosynthesis integral membrane protein MurJ n=1 Tax=Litoribacillus peritrichatus TaxID=718191 RepID=UPI0031D6EA69